MPRTRKPTRYPEIIVAGTPREMGRQIGEQAGELVRRFCEIALESANRMASVPPDLAQYVSSQSMVYARKYAPHLMEEFEGIAESSGVSLLDLMFAQVRNQFSDEQEAACTSVSAAPGFTKTGHHLLAQTWDADPALDEVTIVLTRKPDGLPPYISVGQAGLIGYMGLNGSGIGCCVNTLPAPSRGIGVPHYFSLRRIFEQSRLQQVVSVLEDAYRAIPVNIMLTSEQGPANIEATPEQLYVLKDSRYLVHTNHCLHEELTRFNDDYDELCQSYSRLPRMHSLINQQEGLLTVRSIAEMFQDHDNFPGSICRHANPDDRKHGFIETVFAIIVDAEARAMYVSRGAPCSAPFERYMLE